MVRNVLSFLTSSTSKQVPYKERLKNTVIVVIALTALLYLVSFVYTYLTRQFTSISYVFTAYGATVLTGGIVSSGIIIMFFTKLLSSNKEKGVNESKFKAIQIVLALLIAILAGILSSSLITLVMFLVGSILTIYLVNFATNYGASSGLNLLVLSYMLLLIIMYLLNIGLPSASSIMAAGGAADLSNATFAFLPIIISLIFIWLGYVLYDKIFGDFAKISNYNGLGGSASIYLFICVLAATFTAAFVQILIAVTPTSINSTFASFTAQYSGIYKSYFLSGGILYLMSNNFPLPYPTPHGGVGYAAYFNFILTGTSNLMLSGSNSILVPEYIHVITYIIATVLFTLLFAKIWAWLTRQDEQAKLAGINIYKSAALFSALYAISIICGVIIGGSFACLIAGGALYQIKNKR